MPILAAREFPQLAQRESPQLAHRESPQLVHRESPQLVRTEFPPYQAKSPLLTPKTLPQQTLDKIPEPTKNIKPDSTDETSDPDQPGEYRLSYKAYIQNAHKLTQCPQSKLYSSKIPTPTVHLPNIPPPTLRQPNTESDPIEIIDTEPIDNIANNTNTAPQTPPNTPTHSEHTITNEQIHDNTPPTNQHTTYQGHTYSVLRYKQTIYVIAISIKTQNTHITPIADIDNPINDDHSQQIQSWIHNQITHTNPNNTNISNTIPDRLLTIVKQLHQTATNNPLTHQHSTIISDVENSETHALDHTQHASTEQIITTLLDQTDYTSPIFSTRLQNLNAIMTAMTSNNHQRHYKHYTKTRKQFINHIKRPDAPPQYSFHRPTIIRESPNQRIRQGRRVSFQFQIPNDDPPSMTRPRTAFPTQQIERNHITTNSNSFNPTNPSYPADPPPQDRITQNTTPQINRTPGLSTYHNHSVDINWEEPTITTEIKIINQPNSLSQQTPSIRTNQMTEKQLPTWRIMFYISLFKIISAWNRASAETLYQREQMVQWPTFRPIRLLKAATPILILLLTLQNIPQAFAAETNNFIQRSKPLTSTHNQMDDKNIQIKPHSGIKNHFIYDWQGDAIINPSIHYYTIHYRACDIQTLKVHLQDMIKHHSNLCQYTPESVTEQKHLIQTQDDHHILINKQMNIVQARKTCNSMNTKLIEVRNANQTHSLETFMTKNRINNTFSGIYYDTSIQEFLYTNGDYISDRDSKTNGLPPPYSEYYNKLSSWATLLSIATNRNSYKPIFLYTKAGSSNLVTLAVTQHGHYTMTSNADHQTSTKAFPICATPRATHSRNLIIQQWKNQCLNTHNKMTMQLQATIKRIAQLAPSKLPQPINNIQLFGNYSYLFNSQIKGHAKNQQPPPTTQICNRYLSNTTNFQGNDKQPNFSTQYPPQHLRQKRSLTPLDFLPTATYIYNAIQFIAQIYHNYVNTHPNSTPNPSTKDTQQYIYYLTKQNAYDRDFEETTSFISTTNIQTKLQIHITDINSYINLILDKLDKFYNTNYRAQPTDFLTKSHYDAIRYTIYQNHGMIIPKHLRQNKIFLNTNKEDYIMTLAIPLQPHYHKTDLFRITPMPIWHNYTRYIPHIPHTTFGIPRQGTLNFITTTEEELIKCVGNSYCETAKGTQKATQPPCGINQFFHNNENCAYKKDDTQHNWFYQMENVIYFSIKPDTTTPMNLECSGNSLQGIATTNQIGLTNYGETTIPFNCQANIDDNIYRPAIRTIFELHKTNKQKIQIKTLHPKPNFRTINNTTTFIITQDDHANSTLYHIALCISVTLLLILITLTNLAHRYYKGYRRNKRLKRTHTRIARAYPPCFDKPLYAQKQNKNKTECIKSFNTNDHSTSESEPHQHIYTQILQESTPSQHYFDHQHALNAIQEETIQDEQTFRVSQGA